MSDKENIVNSQNIYKTDKRRRGGSSLYWY